MLECAIHGSELVTEQTVKDELLCWQTWDGLLIGLYDIDYPWFIYRFFRQANPGRTDTHLDK